MQQGQQRFEIAGGAPAMKVLTGGRHSPDLEGVKKGLADYIAVVETSMLATGRADERGHYQQHLAVAASMFAALEKERSGERLQELLSAERRAYGLALLSGPAAETAEVAFAAFAAQAEKAVKAPAPSAVPAAGERKEKMKSKEEKKRYEVRFELFPPHDANTVTYQVFTTMGPTKAIVIATQSHLERKGDPIHRVVTFKPLAGDAPGKHDLVDRLEF
ncbi:MAG: hypothetical protein M0017_08875 [Desulfobacteraceae bacterium]|nr:hypothetical protein [Desulfobacteraceae bacterium]